MLNDQTRYAFLSLITYFMLAASCVALNDQAIKNRIEEYLSEARNDASKLEQVLLAGSMNGHFKSDEIYDLFFWLTKEHSQFVTSHKIGTTFQKRDMYAFKLVKPNNTGAPITKSKILFTGAHHSRELLTTTVCLKIFIESLHSLLHKTEISSIWTFNDLIIVPIVNLDGHQFISKSFGTPQWDTNIDKRKNMNTSHCP